MPVDSNKLKTYVNGVILATFILLTGLSIVLGLLCVYPIRFIDYGIYRQFVRLGQQTVGSALVILVYLLAPTQLVLTGDHAALGREKIVLMANHQIYPDWIYLWCLAWYTKNHGDLKIILMHYLRHVPIIGWLCLFFEFIFMKQKWALDCDNMTKHLQRAKQEKSLWLVIFPEGTLNTPGNIAKSRDYAEKNGIKEHPKHVILPKSRGLQYAISSLRPQVRTLVDVTIGYSGISADQIPYDAYLVENVFMKSIYPKQIYLHVRTFDIDKIPGFDGSLIGDEGEKKRFEEWLRARYMEKDAMMVDFFSRGRLDPNVVEEKPYSLEKAVRSDIAASPVTSRARESSVTQRDVREKRKVVNVVPDLNDWVKVLIAWWTMKWTFPVVWWITRLLLSVLFFGYV